MIQTNAEIVTPSPAAENKILRNVGVGMDIDGYLKPLIDDVKDLWAKPGVETIDVATSQKFNIRVMVYGPSIIFLLEVVCLGGVGKVTRHALHVMKTLHLCSLDFNGEIEDIDPPREFSQDEIMTQLARLPTRVKGKHPKFRGVKIKCNILVEMNWIKRSIFYELEYWSFLTLKHNLDVMNIKKNVLESIFNTLLMNEKSKDTTKARQDLKSLGIRSGLWLDQNKNRKCSKPQAAYSFTLEDKKKFCLFIKGVKLPDGFRSNFKHKVTNNDTNITGLKSHVFHIMMQCLLPYGLQQYLPLDIAKPLIELCLFFKQIFSQTLMVDDMLKAQSKVIDILCNLELIYPPDFFDIMIHLVIHLPLEAISSGPICPRWMYSFKRFMKKLKNYVQNKAKPKGSIAEGYVFKSLCKLIGLQSVIPIDHQELKKVIWCVLHNGPEIDTYRAKFKRIPWLVWEVDNDPGVSESSELFALACGPSRTPISVSSCVFNGVRFVVHNRDECRTTQNSSICSPGPDREIYYDGRSIDVDAPSDIIDVDEDDDIIDEEDPIHHDLADSDVKTSSTLILMMMSADVARGHVGDGGCDDHPFPYQIPTGCEGCLGKGTRKPNLGGRRAGRMHTRQETQNLELKAIIDKNAPFPIWFEFGKRETLMPLGDHATHWANYLESSLGSCRCTTLLGVKFCRSERPSLTCVPTWNLIAGKNLCGHPATFVKDRQWQEGCSQGKMESSATQEYPSLIHTFFLTHTVGGVFLKPEDKALYRGHIPGVGRVLPGHGTVIPPLPPCTHTSDVVKLKKSKKRLTRRVNMFMKLFKSDDKFSQMLTYLESQPEYGGGSGSGGCGDDEPGDDEDGGEDEEDADS
nr:hypothetical protein [Tanacetum cinerariifolium]